MCGWNINLRGCLTFASNVESYLMKSNFEVKLRRCVWGLGVSMLILKKPVSVAGGSSLYPADDDFRFIVEEEIVKKGVHGDRKKTGNRVYSKKKDNLKVGGSDGGEGGLVSKGLDELGSFS